MQPSPLDHPVLFVIDVQQALFERSTPIYQAEALLDNLCALIDRARRAGAPVVYVQHQNQSLLARDTAGWQLHPRLEPRPTDLRVYKQHGNSFEATDLQAQLEARGVKTVVVCGLVSHGCVRASVLGALDLGYRALLVRGGHSNYHKKAAQVIAETEAELAAAGAELVEVGEVAFYSGINSYSSTTSSSI